MSTTVARTTTATDLEILDDVTRREFLAGLAAAGLLAACGDDGGGALSGDSPTGRSVDHGLGTTVAPPASAIRSVVVLEGRRDLETALALDLPVVGAPSSSPDAPFSEHLDGLVAGVEPLFARGELNIEAIAAASPDLIITRESNAADVYAELSQIAPVLPVRGDGPWRDDLRFVAGAVDLAGRAEEVIEEHEAAQRALVADHQAALARPIAVVQYIAGGEMFWSSPNGFLLQAQVLDELGGTFVESQLDAGESEDFSAELIAERFESAEGILLITELDPAAELAELAGNVLWAGLPAVEAGAIVTVPFQLNYGSIIAADACLRRFRQLFEAMA